MNNIEKKSRQHSLPSRAYQYQPIHIDESELMLNARRLVEKLLRRKYHVGAVALLVLIPAAIATFLTTPLYRSGALIQANPDTVQVMPYRDVADSPGGGGTLDNYMGSQEQILKGAGLTERVAQRLTSDFAGEPAAEELPELGARFSVRRVPNTQLFELTYLAPSPEAAATVVNLFAEEYVKQNFELRQATRVRAEQDLKKELDALEGRLQLSEQELMAYAKTNDIMSVEQGQVDPIQDRLTILTAQLAESEAAVAVARVNMETVQRTSVDEFPQRLVTQEIGNLQGNLLQLEQDLTALRSTFGENWPAVVEKRNEIEVVREQLTIERSAVLSRHREQARLDLVGAEARRTISEEALVDQKDLVNRFHDASIEYNILRREVETNRNLHDGLLERLNQTGVMAGFQFGNIQVVEEGRPNARVASPRVFLNLTLASVLGLGLGLCLVVLADFWDNTISTMEEAEQLAPFPGLGSVPLIKGPSSAAALLHARRHEGQGVTSAPALPPEVTESVRGICASLLLSRSDERPRVVVVTSASQGEGKTTLVGHLGRAFADAGSRTLLIEADLRKPDLSKTFSIGNEGGLSLYLSGHVSPWPKIHETEVPNLSIVAAGPMPPNPAALLHSEKLGLFLKAAAADYQVVIVDAPPLLSIADTRILGLNADGVVLVIRAGKTAKTLVRRAWRVLEGSGANVLGMVLNGWEPDRSEMTHYRYYHTSA